MNRHEQQRGAVSLFVVIFATLLITIVTVSFLRFMVQGQQEISDQDLSQSALDSAQAGVQDASRGLLGYEKCINDGSASCGTPSNWANCNGIIFDQVYNNSNPSQGNPEVSVQKDITNASNPDQSLNQAYTCVTVNLDNSNVLEAANSGGSKLVPLQSTSAFSYVWIQWFSRDDLAANNKTYSVNLQNPSTTPLPLLQQYDGTTQTGWSPNRPSVLRVQLMQYHVPDKTNRSDASGFTLSDFDQTNGTNSDANTLFLYPTGFTNQTQDPTPSTASFLLSDPRPTTNAETPLGVKCQGVLGAGGYACSEILAIPTAIIEGNQGGTGTPQTQAYLRITPLYNASHYSVSLLSSPTTSSVVPFHNVQPTIDSTGRANDVFKRVQVRVDLLNNNLPFPADAVDVTGNFCKDFAVTNNVADYASINSGTCKP